MYALKAKLRFDDVNQGSTLPSNIIYKISVMLSAEHSFSLVRIAFFLNNEPNL